MALKRFFQHQKKQRIQQIHPPPRCTAHQPGWQSLAVRPHLMRQGDAATDIDAQVFFVATLRSLLIAHLAGCDQKNQKSGEISGVRSVMCIPICLMPKILNAS